MDLYSPLKKKRFPKKFLFTHHKAGYLLIKKIFKRICEDFDWKFEVILGKCNEVSTHADVILFAHSMVDLTGFPSFRGVHIIRDPRDVITSGYLYHKRCREKWCINNDFSNLGEPIKFPIVPYSQEYRPESWKKNYVNMLNGKSYQDNLLVRNDSDGMLFEMQNYGGWTIESMLAWNYSNPNVMELKLETITGDFDATFARLFTFMEFTGKQIECAMEIARTEDINRMSDDQITSRHHISSGEISKWKKYFQSDHKQFFKEEFGDALIRLGYEQTNNW